MKCENCNIEHNGSYGSGRFCSSRCARAFSTKNKRTDINRKISKALTKADNKLELICKYCNKNFQVFYKKRQQQFCSSSCSTTYNNYNGIASLAGKASAAKKTKRSKNEIYFYELCSKHFKNVSHNEQLFNGWDADIIIEEYKIAVLWNGKWHYEQITDSHSVLQVQTRDRLKIKEIEKCNYTPYIIKDMGKENKKFVEEEFNKFLQYIAL